MTADVSTSQVAAIVVAAAALVVMIVLVAAVVIMARTLASLRVTVEDLRRTTVPLVDDLHTTVQRATVELERVDTLLGTAESISSTVDSASRLAYLTFSNPVIKALALASGTSRAVRRFRRDQGPE